MENPQTWQSDSATKQARELSNKLLDVYVNHEEEVRNGINENGFNSELCVINAQASFLLSNLLNETVQFFCDNFSS